MDLNRLALAVHDRLLNCFGSPEWPSQVSSLDILINTILSQNTNDTNRDRAYTALRQSFPSWEAVRDARAEEVEEAIRPAGLAKQKGPRIQQILLRITQERGDLNLKFLNELSTEEAREWLMQFNGVGPKTAAIVLLFSLDKPAFPVDTHIYRVSGRLGLRPQGMTVEQAHSHLEKLFPSDTYITAHLNLIHLGREVCIARRPDCPVCPLNDLCAYYVAVHQAEEESRKNITANNIFCEKYHV